ncbi:MAG TPA: M20/M25/M40 family metallo-hydrolase [Vicinamibacterales bacterium]
MDPLGVVELTRLLVDIDSTTGQEGRCGRVLADYLRGRGFAVTEQQVDGDRFNVLAAVGTPRVVLSTHFDCVPPFFPSRIEGSRLYGRGSCDAKGILAAQVEAVERLRAAGVRDIGMLYVVGEERGSDGAAAANRLADGSCRFLINGEPTDNRLGLATRGVFRTRLRASGRAAHSSHPELGESAIEKLIDALVKLRSLPLPEDPDLGRTHYTVGLIEGGVAPNVIPPSATAEVLVRTVGPPAEVRQAMRALEPLVTLEDVLEGPPVRMHTVPGFETAVFPYMTDIPLLDRWGKPLLYGPGSVLVAHTDEEHIEIADLDRAVDDYVRLVHALLG